jgi:hypothetical protein
MIPLTEMTVKIGAMVGFSFWAGWLAAFLLGFAWIAAIRWVDDNDGEYKHPMLSLFRLDIVEKRYCKHLVTKSGKIRDLWDVILTGIFGAVWVPILGMLVVVLLHFYALPLTVAVLVLVAFLARAGKRHGKMFDKHTKDPEAHDLGRFRP